MGMKSQLGMLAVMSMMMRTEYADNSNSIKPEEIDIIPKNSPIPKGCQKYVYKESFGTLEVIALNEKSALRKYNKWCNANSRLVV